MEVHGGTRSPAAKIRDNIGAAFLLRAWKEGTIGRLGKEAASFYCNGTFPCVGTWSTCCLPSWSRRSLLPFIFLGARSFGTQIATVLVYRYFAFWYLFVPKYDPRNKTVQQQIPRLIAIHCGLLIFLFIGQTVSFGMKQPRLPSYWLRPHGKQGDTLYGALIFVPVIVFTTQVFILRGILSRSLKGSDMPSSIDKM